MSEPFDIQEWKIKQMILNQNIELEWVDRYASVGNLFAYKDSLRAVCHYLKIEIKIRKGLIKERHCES